jgi:hypothetical protein
MWTKAKNLQRQCIVAEQRQLPARLILDGGFRRWGYRVRRQLHRWSDMISSRRLPFVLTLVSIVVFRDNPTNPNPQMNQPLFDSTLNNWTE